jgi:hypothetical protein
MVGDFPLIHDSFRSLETSFPKRIASGRTSPILAFLQTIADPVNMRAIGMWLQRSLLVQMCGAAHESKLLSCLRGWLSCRRVDFWFAKDLDVAATRTSARDQDRMTALNTKMPKLFCIGAELSWSSSHLYPDRQMPFWGLSAMIR